MSESCLLVGAGAEVGLGLPSGPKFLLDTYFTKKPTMYEALRDFYETKCTLPKGIPGYRAEYLFTPHSAAFHSLADNLNEVNPQYVSSLLGTPAIDETLTDKQYDILFEKLIYEDSNEPSTREDIVEAASNIESGFYGSLESMYSTLIHPDEHKNKFWRLLNYYWAAYFSILLPVISRNPSLLPGFDADYKSILGNLGEITRIIWDDTFVERFVDKNTYHAVFRNKFDFVLTTNYTPYSRAFLKRQDQGCEDALYLAGSLVEFESASMLEHQRCVETDPCDLGCPFPYLMTRSPVKPIIDAQQLQTYAEAINALDDSSLLVVLGYSFCDDDAHIAALVRSFLSNDSKQMVFLGYDDVSVEQHTGALQRALRVDANVMDRVQVLPVHDVHSPAVEEVGKLLSALQ